MRFVFEAYDGELFETLEAVKEYCRDRPYRLGMMGWKKKKVNDPASDPESALTAS